MTYEDLVKLIELFKQNPMAGLIAALPWIVLAIRWVLANTPAPQPGTWWATVAAVLNVIAGVIPNRPNDPVIKKAAEQAVDAKVAEVGTDQIVGASGDDEMKGGPFRRDRMRRRFRRIAREGELDISLLGDDEIEEAIARAEEEHMKAGARGPIMDFLAWVMANKETILDILKLILSFTGDDVKAKVRK